MTRPEPGLGAGPYLRFGSAAVAAPFHGLLPIDTSAPAQARRWVASQLADTHLVELTSPATLVVSELVTNALRGADRRLELDVCVGPDSVDIGVADDAPGEPHVRDAGSFATGGRGLPLIDAVVKSRHVVHDAGGKEVWCRLEPKGR